MNYLLTLTAESNLTLADHRFIDTLITLMAISKHTGATFGSFCLSIKAFLDKNKKQSGNYIVSFEEKTIEF